MKRYAGLIAPLALFSLTFVVLASCSNTEAHDEATTKADSTKKGSANTATDSESKPKDTLDFKTYKPGDKINHEAILEEIAKRYVKWNRVDDSRPHWAPTQCKRPSSGKGRISDTKGKRAHAGKLFYLYASERLAYLTMKQSSTQPIGQMLVKEAYRSVEVTGDKRSNPDQPFAKKDGRTFECGDKVALFIMYKMDPAIKGTDKGWVYGTVDLEGKATSSGLVKSCMGCHKDADHDRLFGLN